MVFNTFLLLSSIDANMHSIPLNTFNDYNGQMLFSYEILDLNWNYTEFSIKNDKNRAWFWRYKIEEQRIKWSELYSEIICAMHNGISWFLCIVIVVNVRNLIFSFGFLLLLTHRCIFRSNCSRIAYLFSCVFFFFFSIEGGIIQQFCCILYFLRNFVIFFLLFCIFFLMFSSYVMQQKRQHFLMTICQPDCFPK